VPITRADLGKPVDSAPQHQAKPTSEAPLPSLEVMVDRIPSGVREALDDLFRVKFVGVQRIPASALQPPGPP
jgi:hypothetical protein